MLLKEPDPTGELAIFIHKTVVREFCKMWRNISRKVKWTIFKYPLQIGDKCYDMRIINITLPNRKKFDVLRQLIRNAQFSFPMEENIALFTDAKSFRILEDFIKKNHLESYILQVTKKTGIASNDDIIKVVTFHESAKALRLVEKYRTHLIFNDRYSYPQPQYYYMAFGFPWLQPALMKHFKILLTCDELYLDRVLSIIFQLIGTHKYNYDLNIFELLTLRLAMCDYRNPSTSNSIKHEIDFMVKRELSKIIENNVFDTGKYLIARNYPQQDLLICYLAYEHQNNLRAISFNNGINLKPEFRAAKVRHTIELVHESNALNVIRENCNVMFCVDGLGYHRMSLSFFLDLFERDNVEKIILDTNFRWLTDVCNLNRVITNSNDFRSVHFIGSNTFNFIQDFVSSFKLARFGGYDGTILNITCSLKDYSIFKNMRVQINFSNIKIDAHLLIGLHLSELRLRCNECTFENKFRNWALLNSLSEYSNVEILEDEGTWQSMFEFISQFLINNNYEYKEFRFVGKAVCIKSNHITNAPGSRVQIDNIKFKLDALNSKLEICSSNNQILDLYDIKFGLSPSDKTEYDFYQ